MVMGQSQIWSPWVMDDIHAKAEVGRYRVRGFSSFQKVTHFDDLVFLSTGLTRFPLEGYKERCNTQTVIGHRYAQNPLVLETPVYVTGMSYGALSRTAKTALARGTAMTGTATCTGDGGMLPQEREEAAKLIYQILPSRYGLSPHDMIRADALEIVVGQGAKPGTGGLLMGVKVLDDVAAMRDLPTGIDQRSPTRHPDWLGPDDLTVKIEQLREATDWRVPIHVKLGACRVSDDVKLAAKAGADAIVIDSMMAGTGASAEVLLDHSGIPTVPAIVQAREALAGNRPLRKGQPHRIGRDSQRCRRRQSIGPRRRRRGHRSRRPHCSQLQQRDRGVGLREGDRRARRPVPPLPHRQVSRGHHHPRPGAGEASRRSRGC